MTILGLIALVVVACILAWFADRSGWPDPLRWLIYGIIIVVFVYVLLSLAGVNILNQRL